jgi:predicted metal-binding transcription factor (methanogenesis marker protein 9)
MARKLAQLFAVAALFGGLTASTVVLAGQTASSSPTHCEKMTIDCWQKDEEMERLNQNDGKCMSQMKDACGRMMRSSNKANPHVQARCGSRTRLRRCA